MDDYFEITQVFVEQEIKSLEQKLKNQPRNGKLRRSLINAYRKKGDIAMVIKNLQALKETPKFFTQYYQSLYSILSQEEHCIDARGVSPVPYRLFENVFKRSFIDSLWEEIRNKRDLFTNSEVYSTDGGAVDKTVRDSQCLYKKSIGDELKMCFLDEITRLYKNVESFFCRNSALLCPRELELNVYRRGVGFVRHTDAGSQDGMDTREITFLYYFYQDPKAFAGGDLALFDTNRKQGDCGVGFSRINITNNSLLFFPSDCWHQVTQLKSAGESFYSGRFTLNGWFHSK